MAQGRVIRQLLASLTSIELNRLHQTIDVAFQAVDQDALKKSSPPRSQEFKALIFMYFKRFSPCTAKRI